MNNINSAICDVDLAMAVNPVALEAWGYFMEVLTPALAAMVRTEYRATRTVFRGVSYTAAYVAADERVQAESRLPEARAELRVARRTLRHVRQWSENSTAFRFDTLFPALRRVADLEAEVAELEATIASVPFTLQDVEDALGSYRIAESCRVQEHRNR